MAAASRLYAAARAAWLTASAMVKGSALSGSGGGAYARGRQAFARQCASTSAAMRTIVRTAFRG